MREPVSGTRHDYWFPLALLGFLLLGTLLAVPAADHGWFAYVPQNRGEPMLNPGALYSVAVFTEFDQLPDFARYGPGDPLSWNVPGWAATGLALVLVASLAWYAVGRRRAGEAVRPGRLVAVLAACVPAIVLVALGGSVSGSLTGAVLVNGVLPLTGLALVTAAATYFSAGTARRVAGWCCLVAVVLVVGLTLSVLSTSESVVLLPAGALAVLAWFERSVLLALIAPAFATAAVALDGRFAVVAAAAVLLAGALAALVTRGPAASGLPAGGQ
ncbi:hypothetical protein [Amycolatopsis suaedae]|uniref:Uncharacterized protein n=1 Tax=Amycolatopsis suaedae TaxID=2510978 RepID=A0A4Q7J8G9_9PSEU|nr:hypothetical protein [Amycolatopsis suaedae]RZQ63206.1 hypothetical protein EWH70_16155 [Amycolatopsis suaedae]